MAQEHRLNITSNNLANTNTAGYKRDVPVFEGYVVKATKTDFRQGHLEQTENVLDMALSGPGFFQINTPEGIQYTRNGTFTRNAQGEIVTQEGHTVVGGGLIPADVVELSVAEDGSIYADGDVIGRFEIVEFEDPEILAKAGRSNFVTKVEGVQGQPAAETTVAQGYIERSNSDPVLESINLIDTVRTYEVFQKVVLTFQEIGQKTFSDVGRLT
jgi:flagellar basal-body rod protein FlgG